MKRARLAAMGVRFVEGEDGHAGNGPASENSGQQPPQQQEAPSGTKGGPRENGEHGYPTSTPLTEMTSAMVQVPLRMSSSALPVQTSVP